MLCLNSEKICSTFVFAIAGSLLSYVTLFVAVWRFVKT